MLRNGLLSFLIILVITGACLFLPAGCANIIPPAGGPRDSLPPQLVSATPKDSSTNFNAARVTLSFDEYIDDLQDIQNNLLFTPTFETNPEIAVRAKNVTIRFRDSLLPNTTYILNFGNAIRDVNENNVLRNFIYTFSTGPVLDSLTLKGKVVMAETGGTDSTLIVMLHRSLVDSAVYNQRPTYIARVDASGNFSFGNLPPGNFAIYALGEAGLVRRYQNKSQAFAFYNQPVNADSSKEITLYAYQEQKTGGGNLAPIIGRPNIGATDRRLRVTTNLVGSLDLASNYTLGFASPLAKFDSTQVSLSADSTFSPVSYTSFLDSARTTLYFQSAWKEGTTYNIVLNRDFAEDSAGRKLLKTDTLNFTTKNRSDYGRLDIKISQLDASRRPVLQFVQNGQVVLSAPLRNGQFVSALFKPGDYDLRILYDSNGNGKWDAGQFFGVKRQPELVQPISQGITVKAAWDNEFERLLQ